MVIRDEIFNVMISSFRWVKAVDRAVVILIDMTERWRGTCAIRVLDAEGQKVFCFSISAEK